VLHDRVAALDKNDLMLAGPPFQICFKASQRHA
jgi:hypothetical protein